MNKHEFCSFDWIFICEREKEKQSQNVKRLPSHHTGSLSGRDIFIIASCCFRCLHGEKLSTTSANIFPHSATGDFFQIRQFQDL